MQRKHGFVRQHYDCFTMVENLLLITSSHAWAHVEINAHVKLFQIPS